MRSCQFKGRQGLPRRSPDARESGARCDTLCPPSMQRCRAQSRTPAQGRCSEQHGGGLGGARGQGRLGVEGLDGALDGDQHGVAVAILGLGGGDLHPTFADAVLLDIGALLAVHANADFVLEALRHMVRAARVGRQTVGQGRFVVAHFIYLSVIKSGPL